MKYLVINNVEFRSKNGAEIECLSSDNWVNIDMLILENDSKRFVANEKIFSYKIIENAIARKFKLVLDSEEVGAGSAELLSIVMSSKSKDAGISFSRGRWNIFINSKYVTSAREKEVAIEYRKKLLEYVANNGITVEQLKIELKSLKK